MTILISYQCDDCNVAFDSRDDVVEIPAKQAVSDFQSAHHTERHVCSDCASDWLWDYGNRIKILLNPDGSVFEIDVPSSVDGEDVPVDYIMEEIA